MVSVCGLKAATKFLSSWEGDKDASRDQAFLRLIAREYFRVIGTANKKHDPDHLIFGDRLSFYTYDADVLEEMLPWVDAIAFQPHFWGPFPKKELDEIHELAGKPILLCDFAIRFKDGDKDVRNWKLADDSVAAGKAYTEYVKAALDTDYILGVFWCNPIDSEKGFGNSGVKQGFFGDGLTERPGLHEAARKLNLCRTKVTPSVRARVKPATRLRVRSGHSIRRKSCNFFVKRPHSWARGIRKKSYVIWGGRNNPQLRGRNQPAN